MKWLFVFIMAYVTDWPMLLVLILFMKVFSSGSRELVIHRFESINDSVSELQTISSLANSFHECRLINENVSGVCIY